MPPAATAAPRIAASVRELLLTRSGLAFVSSSGPPLDDVLLRAVEIELGDLGFVLSTRLRSRLQRSTLDELVGFRSWAHAALAAHLGANQKHEPLFRSFPERIPDDTLALWWSKVLVHFLQAPGQPCLFCRRTGTTHVLNPCGHVVCEHCFDGASYSACPVCEHRVDRASPFFKPSPERSLSKEQVTFKLLDLAQSEETAARALFVSLCERKQALSPDDRGALVVLLKDYGARVLDWLPAAIPVRENVAMVFGTLFGACPPDIVLPVARRYMTTATDVLRFIAVLSGTDGSLQKEMIWKQVERTEQPSRFWGKIAALLRAWPPSVHTRKVTITMQVRRFKVARMARPLRRALLAILEGLDEERLIEDVLRHRSYWVWVGEFLHPHEYEQRYPKVARAFQVARKFSPRGVPAPAFHGFYWRMEAALIAKDSWALVEVLGERPGELARRFDLALRVAGDNDAAVEQVLSAFTTRISLFATPVLLTLWSQLPTRLAPAPVRVYWPKGKVARGISAHDDRTVLSRRAVDASMSAITAELIARFEKRLAFASCIVDRALGDVMVPFNERTASSAAVSLPRGSRIPVPVGKTLRLFLHWCEPQKGGYDTDLDLSVGFYDEAWRYKGVCSYYDLKPGNSGPIATSAGDLQSAPWPDGATEFVDLHRERALGEGIRYAVMVVNAYAGMPFGQLERAFAGLMVRDDTGGSHFDPRTVQLKFALAGDNGIYLPVVYDLVESRLHWLDVQSKGQLEYNNVESSQTAIARICPELITYFASGVRPSMRDLALLHAAARARQVFVRGDVVTGFTRHEGESAVAFHARLVRGQADELNSTLPSAASPPVLAALFRGDIALPDKSAIYALFREQVTPDLAASDFLS